MLRKKSESNHNARNLPSHTQLEDSGFKVSVIKIDNISKDYIVKNTDMSTIFLQETRSISAFTTDCWESKLQQIKHRNNQHCYTQQISYDTNSTTKIRKIVKNFCSWCRWYTIPANIPDNTAPPTVFTSEPVEFTTTSSSNVKDDVIEDDSDSRSEISNKKKNPLFLLDTDVEHVQLTHNKYFLDPQSQLSLTLSPRLHTSGR
jgi:hypothetical protein